VGSIPGQKRGVVGRSFTFLDHLAVKNGRSDRYDYCGLSTITMSLRNLSDLFLYEFWTLCDAKEQVIAVLLRMGRLACNYKLLEELKAQTDQAKRAHVSYQSHHLKLPSDSASEELRSHEGFDRIKRTSF
jgi:hypothetical protein